MLTLSKHFTYSKSSGFQLNLPPLIGLNRVSAAMLAALRGCAAHGAIELNANAIMPTFSQ